MRRENLIEKKIDQMVQRIVVKFKPEKIVLFGSWARGEASEQSDVDFLVVEREPFGPTRSRRREAARIWRCLSSFRVSADILVYSVGEVAQWKDSRHHVIAKALREGRVLHESN